MYGKPVKFLAKRETILRKIIDNGRVYEALVILIQRVGDYDGGLYPSKPKFYDFYNPARYLEKETNELRQSISEYMVEAIKITDYQRRIISLMAEGFNYQQIATKFEKKSDAIKGAIENRFKEKLAKFLELDKEQFTVKEALKLLTALGLELN